MDAVRLYGWIRSGCMNRLVGFPNSPVSVDEQSEKPSSEIMSSNYLYLIRETEYLGTPQVHL